jgi:hypothetical protein
MAAQPESRIASRQESRIEGWVWGMEIKTPEVWTVPFAGQFVFYQPLGKTIRE